MKPRIGLTTFDDPQSRAVYVSLSSHYTRSIRDGGGIPFPIPQCQNIETAEDYIANIDGLLLTGGKDIDPFFFGQEPVPGIGVFDEVRDAWELALFSAAMGGTLYQDLQAQRSGTNNHSPEEFPVDRLYHSIALAEGSILHRIFAKRTIRANSFHHQAIDKLSSGLLASAFAPDGVIEGFESRDSARFIAGVQFHPESLTLRFPEFLGIFKAFTDVCKS
ncbi:MAG TPA: gamma-glutamyl-gamma-aminobutyrate hydrolase family protein [Rectinemataceae bacterium]|nr:gamma-glutamyl-gamma-aminobutyrate hydrolase family protein [Rectinemataceae bacterium]